MYGIKIATSIILAFLGLFYLAAPHALHISSGLGLGLDHAVFPLLGIILLAVAALLYLTRNYD